MLNALLRERHWQNYGMFKLAYQKAARSLDKDLVETYPSRATLWRWMAGKLKELPYPDHCAVLEAMLPGWTAAELFQPYLAPGEVSGSTLLRELLRRRCLRHYREFCRAYETAAAKIDTKLVGGYPIEPQFHRWISGEPTRAPHPDHTTVLEALFPRVLRPATVRDHRIPRVGQSRHAGHGGTRRSSRDARYRQTDRA
ncbi:MAG: hypothetical protein ACT4NY_14905 [Pseudonocardiales bacterium]